MSLVLVVTMELLAEKVVECEVRLLSEVAVGHSTEPFLRVNHCCHSEIMLLQSSGTVLIVLTEVDRLEACEAVVESGNEAVRRLGGAELLDCTDGCLTQTMMALGPEDGV